ncbi:MAG: hypothetical protein CML70_03780, partial [Rhodobacterales bacterium]
MSYIVAIDQGTTSTRSILFDHNMSAVNISQKELTQYLIKNYRDNPDKYGYISSRYYHGIKYLVNYIFNNYSWNGNVQESKSKKK